MNPRNKGITQALKPRHVPQRSCIVCRNKRNKQELVRLVYNDNIVQIDPKGEKAGRGAYLCPKFECWDRGLKKSHLEYALHTKISPENRQRLMEYAESLSKKEE
jgi:predicted RNA-binding protein YlxR (DUF448 family)